MRIGVSGANGHLGRAVIAELLARGGHEVVGILCKPETIKRPAFGRYGSYGQLSSLIRAYGDLDRLLILPSADLRLGVRAWQFVTAINAARKAGVGHIVMLSIAGLREERDPAPDAAYWTGEQQLIKTTPRWTILRMNFLAESLAQMMQRSFGTGLVTGLGQERVAFVSRADVAAAAAGLLAGEGHVGAIYHATGPEVVTGEERAAITAKVTGRPARFVTVTPEQMRVGLVGLPAEYVGMMLDMYSKFARGGFDIVTGDVARLAGRKPQALHEALPKLLLNTAEAA